MHNSLLKERKCDHYDAYSTLLERLEKICRKKIEEIISERYRFLDNSVDKDSVIDQVFARSWPKFFLNYDYINEKSKGASEPTYLLSILRNDLKNICKEPEFKNKIVVSMPDSSNDEDGGETKGSLWFDSVVNYNIDGDLTDTPNYRKSKASKTKSTYVKTDKEMMAEAGLTFMRVRRSKKTTLGIPKRLVSQDYNEQYYLNYLKNYADSNDDDTIEAIRQIIRYHFISGKLSDKFSLLDVSKNRYKNNVILNPVKNRWEAIANID